MDGNYVVSADIGADGQLVCVSERSLSDVVSKLVLLCGKSLASAVPTGGNGSHGQTGNPIAFDAFFSQAPIVASSSGNVLATVNVKISVLSYVRISISHGTI